MTRPFSVLMTGPPPVSARLHLCVRAAVGFVPQLLELLGLENAQDRVVDELFQRRLERAGEKRGLRRERVVRELLDVDVVEQQRREPRGNRLLDLVVSRQWRDRLHVVVGVEQFVARPHRRDRQRDEDAAEDDQDPREDASPHRDGSWARRILARAAAPNRLHPIWMIQRGCAR